MRVSAAIFAALLVACASADSSFFFNTGVQLNAGQTNTPDRLEQELIKAGFDLKVNPLEKLAFAGERDQICAIYQQEKFASKNIALRAFLRIACELKYEGEAEKTFKKRAPNEEIIWAKSSPGRRQNLEEKMICECPGFRRNHGQSLEEQIQQINRT
uniref:DUF2380 domain-containing protein n=1 Tax=Bursaphelenchus xylophilus TaxID=6326 RepID=A0A1I7RXB2_BURXY